MKFSRSALLLAGTLAAFFAIPESALLPIRNGTLLAFCRRGDPFVESPEVKPLIAAYHPRGTVSWQQSSAYSSSSRFENLSSSDCAPSHCHLTPLLDDRSQSGVKIRELEEEIEKLRAELAQRESGALAVALPAKVVYRGPSSWNSSLWIGAGEIDNRGLIDPVVAKGSPVVVGKALVGVIDYVGRKRSRVSLITDRRLHPSVQAVRGGEVVTSLLSHLGIIEEVLMAEPEWPALRKNLEMLKNHFGKTGLETRYLGKGELCGASRSLWRSKQTVLDGIGFEGEENVSAGDLLMTTGLDGVFPAGLEVGYVVESKRLHPGSPSYSLKALPATGELEGAVTLFVLPPLP